MPFKIDIQTNIDENDLDIDTCTQVIHMLEETYRNVRREMYTYFLGTKHLKIAFGLILSGFLLYVLTKKTLFLYALPVIFFIAMVVFIIMAEFTTNEIRRQVKIKLEDLKRILQNLKRNKELQV